MMVLADRGYNLSFYHNFLMKIGKQFATVSLDVTRLKKKILKSRQNVLKKIFIAFGIIV